HHRCNRAAMKVAFGLKAHSGWAALVVMGGSDRIEILDRRRLELVEPPDASWAKQPYHAAEHLPAADARRLVQRGIEAAHRNATRAMREAVARVERDGHSVCGCAVLMGKPMPSWTVDEILSVHFRMHKAEGVLFRDALALAAEKCKVPVVRVQEKLLSDVAGKSLKTSSADLARSIAMLGKSVAPPWGKDQKEAATAAMIALS